MRILLVLVLLLLAALFYAWEGPIDPVTPPEADAFSAAAVARGEALAGAGNCATCHTVAGGAPYAGGRPMATGFGTVHATNITPHPEDGIGRWSEEAFVRAMREGVRRDGAHLFPAFPYTHFAHTSDDDLAALYAYFMTRQPVAGGVPENTLPFPLNVRLLQAGWKLLYFDGGGDVSDPGRDDAWNRGAYLAEGLGHCGACHTPRNALGAERDDAAYAGAVIDDWYAPALTAANGAPLPWTRDELFAYLRQGATDLHGVAAGSMSAVVHDGLARLPDSDIEALAVYFADLAGAPERIEPAAVRDAMAGLDADHPGRALYAYACESCHYNAPGAPRALRPELTLNSAVTGPDPTNFLRLTLAGLGVGEGHPAAFMHGYAGALTDADIVAIARYLRGPAAADAAGWRDLDARLAELRTALEARP